MEEGKQLTLRLKRVKYAGENIGRDIHFKITIGGVDKSIKKRIDHATTVNINEILVEDDVIQADTNFSIAITMLEEDVVFNDTGSGMTSFPIAYQGTDRQTHTCEVSVVGDLVGDRKKVAIFTLEFEAELKDIGLRYISDVANGWLTVRVDGIGRWNLPYQLKVKVTKETNEREYFTILEGRLKGDNANVKLRDDGSSYLIEEGIHTEAVKLEYFRSNKIVKLIGTTKEYWAIMEETGELPPIPNGTYDIEIPYEPHPGGSYYLRYADRAKTWFKIGHTSDYGNRFFHTGRVTLGCVTVTQNDRWDEIYDYLIASRRDDSSVGTIAIKD